MPIKDVRIEARVRNNVLWHAIYDMWPSVAAFCREEKLDQSKVGKLLNLSKSPLRKRNGFYTKTCEKIASILGFSCDELFPLFLYEVERTRIVVEVSFAELPAGQRRQLAQLPAPKTAYDVVVQHELSRKIEEVLQTLTPREAEVIRLRQGLKDGTEHSYEQVAAELFGKTVTSKRVRQIEEKALRKLCHPSRSRRLQEFIIED